MIMKDPIIWLSYVSYPITTAVYFKRALRKKYKVITCGPKLPDHLIKQWQLENMKLPIKDHDLSTGFGELDFSQQLKSVPKNIEPDLFLWIESVSGFIPTNISGKGFPTACYLIDSHLNLHAHLKWAKNFDYTFVAQREYLNEFKKTGLENVFWLPLGADPEIHSKKKVKKIHNVGFVGSLNSDSHQKRINLLNKISSVAKVSYSRCWWDEMAEFFSASKIVFNNAIRNDLNMRLFETMSTGSFLLTDLAKNSGQEEMFKDGEDLGVYNEDNIIDKIKYFLANENEREKIAGRGQQIIQNAHIYSFRVEELLNVCFNKRKTTPTADEWRNRSLGKIKVAVDMKTNQNSLKSRSFVIPVLDMSPASPYNIVKLLGDLNNVAGDVIVIFNSVEMAEKLKDHPRINYYATMNENVGVSRAWNIGLNISQTPVTFILNSDLNITKEVIDKLENHLLKLSDAAIVGPQGSFFNFYQARDLAYFDKNSFKSPIEVDAVSGFLFAVKTDLFDKGILKFDNRFTPCYFEEWDMGLQIKFAGLKSYIIPVSGYNHEWSGSIRSLRVIKYLNKEETAGEILNRNRILFLNKWEEFIQNFPERKNILISNWAGLMMNQADLFTKQNEKENSYQIYEQVLTEFPEYEEALSKFGMFLYEENKLEDALNIFNRLSAINPDYKLPLNNSTETYNKTGQIIQNNKSKGNAHSFIKEDKSYYENDREDVQNLINPNSKKILDVGCGKGKLGSVLKRKLGAEVWGVEYVSDIAVYAAEKLDMVINCSIEDAINKLPDKYFDTIIFADVLEHLIDPYNVLKKIRTKLSDKGEIVASIPNVRHWSVVKKLLEGEWEYQEFGIMDSTHLRFFTRKSIFSMFEKAGLKITNILYVVAEIEKLSPQLLDVMKESNINIDTLDGESKHFQYIVKAVMK
jgi:2-polyprenyl-3-methyl-5-hydroxy-6-metoxy-1,4-benzoquinol methylase/GT2 family glycosyltransferase